MPSCECCWSASRWDAMYRDDAYNHVMDEHQKRGCACTKSTIEGARLRAGAFWENGKDSRYTDEEWSALRDKLDKDTP